MNLLFICTGNTCRSPMAEGYFNFVARKLGIDAAGKSAGIVANDGQHASDYSVRAMRELFDIDISGHKAKSVTVAGMQSADYVITMTKSHKLVLRGMFPEHEDKIFILSEFAYRCKNGMINIKRENSDSDIKAPSSEGIKFNTIIEHQASQYFEDIADPYYYGLDVYMETAKEIAEYIDGIIASM
jgi:protein-tyrosine-phosphatase